MTDRARRREIRARLAETPPAAGVYLIRNTVSGRALLGSSPNLESARNKLEFGKSTGLTGVVDHRLRADVAEIGLDAFSFEILETLEIDPGMNPAEVRAELATLEALCREQLDGSLLY